MGRVLTNFTSLAYAKESSIGTLPGTPRWKRVEPNDIESYGAAITKTPRDPISDTRQRRKGITTDLDSNVEYTCDMTMDSFLDFIEGFLFATANYPHVSAVDRAPIFAGGAGFGQNLAADNDPPPAGTDAGYTHDAISAAIPADTLIYASGFSTTANNGLKLVLTGSTTTSTLISTALTDEVPAGTTGARIEICGRRAATSDLAITVSAGVATLTSTLLDFTTLGWTLGQLIHIGGLLVANQFSAGAGYGRLRSVSANSATFDKLSPTLATDPGTGDTVDLLFGRFISNVSVSSSLFLEQYYQFELALPDLATGPADAYYYSIGLLPNQATFSMPLTDKATSTFAFVGQDTENPTTSRKTAASTPVSAVGTEGIGTSSDLVRMRVQEVDETGLTTCITSCEIVLNNQVTGEKCLGTLGPSFLNTGNLLVDVNMEAVLTSEAVIAAIRDNETVTFDVLTKNGDGAIGIDIPSMTLGDGALDLPRNESVKIALAGEAFGDASLGYSVGVSTFPVVPV